MEGNIIGIANELEKNRTQAMMQGDGSGLGQYLSEDLLYGHSSGYTESKSEYLYNFNQRNYMYHFVEPTVKNVLKIGENGFVVQGELSNYATLFGKEVKMHSIYLAVWRREGDAWRLLAHQTALIS